MDALACRRHPDTETYLRCSACETPICPACGVEAAVGYQCPDCAASRGAAEDRSRRSGGARLGGAASRPSGDRLSATLAARAGLVGLVAAVVGGLLLGPILREGMLFLISSGVIGWAVARAVFWAADETSTPFVRAAALAFAGFAAAVGLVASGAGSADAGMLFLAYPAALYGGWILIRRR